MNEEPRIYAPSRAFERKTRALDRFLLPIVSGISMFTVSLVIGAFFYAFNSSFLRLPVTHLSVYVFVPMALFVLSGGILVPFMLSLMTAYKFEGSKITRGIISRMSPDGRDLRSTVTAQRLAFIVRLIRQNYTPGFAEQYFDTAAYKKTEFDDVVLIKETKRVLVYETRSGKRLRVLRIYDGMRDTYRSEGPSFGARIAIVSAVVFVIALAGSIADLAVGNYKNVTEYAPAISASKEEVFAQLEAHGYEIFELPNNTDVILDCVKEVGDRESKVYYTFDRNGSIVDVHVQLYFLPESENVEEELRTVIGTMNTEFSEDDVDAFVDAVLTNLDGEYLYYRLRSDKYLLTVGISGEYVDVH